jgi:hypothetical protein
MESVIAAAAGIHLSLDSCGADDFKWIPAFAGMTEMMCLAFGK